MTKEQYNLYEEMCREDWYLQEISKDKNFENQFTEIFWYYANANHLGLDELRNEIMKYMYLKNLDEELI